ncbi:hypothetical protein MANI_017519 [Metarhizium anisopliae]
MSLNEKEVLKQAQEQPEEFVAWTADDIINQPLKEAVFKAVFEARPETTTDAVMHLLHELRSDIYKEKLDQVYPHISFLDRPYVEFQMLSRLCQQFDIKISQTSEVHCPEVTIGPADIVFSTIYLKRQKVEAVNVVAALERDIAEANARKAAKATPETSMKMAWEKVMGGAELPEWPDSADHELGLFDIPFPPGRDWEACYGRSGQKLWLYVSPAVRVDCLVNIRGLFKFVVRLRDDRPATPFNQLELFRSWAGIAAWANELIKGDRDIPITDFMESYLSVSAINARDMFTKVVSGEA